MSEMIECDRCRKTFYTDSRSDKDAYAALTMDYIDGYSSFHLCKKCITEILPFLFPQEEFGFLYEQEDE